MRMKLKVEKEFSDKHTDELYEVGRVIEVSDIRGRELLSHPLELVSMCESEKKTTTRKKKTL